jgi:hypothetical protein
MLTRHGMRFVDVEESVPKFDEGVQVVDSANGSLQIDASSAWPRLTGAARSLSPGST